MKFRVRPAFLLVGIRAGVASVFTNGRWLLAAGALPCAAQSEKEGLCIPK